MNDRASAARRIPRLAGVFGIVAAICISGCVTLTTEPRALTIREDGTIQARRLACAREAPRRKPAELPAQQGLDPGAIHIVSWNIHKQSDAGWQHDLGRFGGDNDIVLLQEAVLGSRLRAIVEDAGLRWVMASSFQRSGSDVGVFTAARVPPIASCTQRVVEPLLRLPKSAVISWFPIAHRRATLAVANVHAINFSLSLGTYRAQFEQIGDALAGHRGPVIVAGDFNTWTDARAQVVHDLASRLGLTEVRFDQDRRSVFFGHELDHIFVRQLALVASATTDVKSSDHNPVAATLRVDPAR